jgi:hypothetical protein
MVMVVVGGGGGDQEYKTTQTGQTRQSQMKTSSPLPATRASGGTTRPARGPIATPAPHPHLPFAIRGGRRFGHIAAQARRRRIVAQHARAEHIVELDHAVLGRALRRLDVEQAARARGEEVAAEYGVHVWWGERAEHVHARRGEPHGALVEERREVRLQRPEKKIKIECISGRLEREG